METTNYKCILKNELARRLEKNSRYSVRAFASSLQIDSGALSRILSGKQIPSERITDKILEYGMLEVNDREDLVKSIKKTHIGRGLQRRTSFQSLVTNKDKKFQLLDIDLFRIIGEWFHSAIMELTYVYGFSSCPKWIAAQLGISETESILALDRLKRSDLIRVTEKDKLEKSERLLDTGKKNISNPALRKNQKQFLEKAINSLENDPIEERSMTSMTMAIDESKVEEAKKIIEEFNQKMCEFMEDGTQARVYNLSVALFPIQKKTNHKFNDQERK